MANLAKSYTDNKTTEKKEELNKNMANAKRETIAASDGYTDTKFNENNTYINPNIDRAKSEAITTADKYSDNKYQQGVSYNNFSYGIGLGNYQNGNAIASGVQYKKHHQNTHVRINASWDSFSNTAIGFGLAGGW